MKRLDPQFIPLQSINLIEASAGTGKSWTVTLLFLRLILEKGLTVDQILVVTFTDAATKELRDAVRDRLLEALAYFETPDADALPADKQEYKFLFDQYASDDAAQAIAINRLKRAKLSIDEAAIFTIHSFCQRVLTEYAFEASLPFESELMDDDTELMQKLLDDYWRQHFYHAPKTLLYTLQQKKITPDSLLADIKAFVGKPYLQIKGPQSEPLNDEDWEQLNTLFKTASRTWQEQADQITRLLINHDGFNQGSYKQAILEKLCADMCRCAGSITDFMAVKADLSKLGMDRLGKGMNKGKEPPEHIFFTQWQVFLDAWEDIKQRSDDYINQLRIDLLKHLQNRLPKEKKRLGVLAYDDLLLQLESALSDKPELAAYLRHKYQAALIDEFQDTDPTQYSIFSQIYPDPNSDRYAVFLVGDPKQAIYSFRGGDIYTYLKAKQSTPKDKHYTLTTNYRSQAGLIDAYNALYLRADNPFLDDGINYVEIAAGKTLTPYANDAALQFWSYQQDQKEPIDKVRQRIASAVAGDIATQLNNKTLIEDQPISGSDIAVLVRTHNEGSLIKQALAERGIASIQSSRDSIFESPETGEMSALLSAIAEPQRESLVRRALVVDLLGYKANDLLAFESDPDLWESQLFNFQNWHFLWKKQGFLPMMRQLMRDTNMHQTLLAYSDGERRLTNILHLSELIHRASRQQSLSLEEVLRWLSRQQQNASGKESELRLESDENLVKIVTIHKSKGLEYPLVYCPYVGLPSKPRDIGKIFSFYLDSQAALQIGSSQHDEYLQRKKKEEKAESLRLLYVALTRAKYRCTVVCFPQALEGLNDSSALAYLLSNGRSSKPKGSKAAEKEESAKNNEAFYQAYTDTLQTLAKENKNINLSELPENSARYIREEKKTRLQAREFTAEIKQQAQVTSFSGLTAGAQAEQQELPDYDTSNGGTIDMLSRAEPVATNQTVEDEFPRGATAGTALHEMFEHLAFDSSLASQAEIITASLKKWGFDETHFDAANTLINNTLQTLLLTDFSLSQLPEDKRLDEMEFYLPLERLNVEGLKQLLFKHLPDDWQVVRDAVDSLDFAEVEGFLKGFIDLIFEYQGKFYIVDYKSNALTDYAPDSLLPVMADSHYYLQYLIYSVALHRYLQKRLPGYAWETHFGGVYYLFIRGMKTLEEKTDSRAAGETMSEERRQPEGRMKSVKKGGGVLLDDALQASEGQKDGIFYNKPEKALINALDSLFTASLL